MFAEDKNQQKTASSLASQKKIESLVGKINDYYTAHNIKSSVPEAGWKREVQRDSSSGLWIDKFEVMNPSGRGSACGIDILSEDQKPVWFMNLSLMFQADRSSYGTESSNDLSEEQILKMAQEFSGIFLKDWAINDLKAGKVFWDKPFKDSLEASGFKKNLAGRWKVIWRRETPEGIPFNEDQVDVTVYAKYGPTAISISYNTQYEEKPFTKIGQIKALEIARQELTQALKKLGLNVLLGEKPKESKEAKVSEMIVQVPRKVKTAPIQGRDAYVVGFYLSGQNSVGAAEKLVIMSIDAETGEVISAIY